MQPGRESSFRRKQLGALRRAASRRIPAHEGRIAPSPIGVSHRGARACIAVRPTWAPSAGRTRRAVVRARRCRPSNRRRADRRSGRLDDVFTREAPDSVLDDGDRDPSDGRHHVRPWGRPPTGQPVTTHGPRRRLFAFHLRTQTFSMKFARFGHCEKGMMNPARPEPRGGPISRRRAALAIRLLAIGFGPAFNRDWAMVENDWRRERNEAPAGYGRLEPPRRNSANENRLDPLVRWPDETNGVDGPVLVHAHIHHASTQPELTRLIELVESREHRSARVFIR